MGQQHILFLILGVCIIGIALSAGTITLQSHEGINQRQFLYDEMQRLAARAQEYRRLPFEENGGDGTFIGLTATPYGIARLTKTPTTPFGEFQVSKSGNSHAVEITAIGNSAGNDPRRPVKIVMTVFSNRTSVLVVN
jgi:hypothetical protein